MSERQLGKKKKKDSCLALVSVASSRDTRVASNVSKPEKVQLSP